MRISATATSASAESEIPPAAPEQRAVDGAEQKKYEADNDQDGSDRGQYRDAEQPARKKYDHTNDRAIQFGR
jgi:hypothetical protein